MVKRVFAIHEVARTTSTQDVVRRAAGTGAAEGFCCLAAEQTAGRGRFGRGWIAAPGTAMLASVLVRTSERAAPGVPFAAGLAMRDAVVEISGVDARLKWPNDLLAGNRKLAGILVERTPGVAGAPVALIVGAGANLTVSEFPAGAVGVSLNALTDAVPSARRLLEAWLWALDRRLAGLEERGLAALMTDWRRLAAGLGSPVRVRTPSGVVDGVAEDVRDDGSLVVRTRDGVVPVLAGDVELMPADWQARRMHEG